MEWRQIVFAPSYEVSNTGRVRNTNFNRGGVTKEMSYFTAHNGYKMVGIMVLGRQKSYGVHRLVAQAFIPNPKGLPFVNHMNGDKTDNRVENLEWITNKDNQLHGFYKLGHHGLTKPIRCIETGEVYQSAQQAGRELGICSRNIAQAAQPNHRMKSAGGYHWERLTH